MLAVSQAQKDTRQDWSKKAEVSERNDESGKIGEEAENSRD